MTPEQEVLADGLTMMRQQTAQFVRDLEDHAGVLPLDPATTPTAAIRVNITAFIKRFELMQDQISRKLFRSVLAVRGRPLRTRNLVEVVETASELGLVSDLAEWKRLTELRNVFSHDYVLIFDVFARLVNEAWAFCPVLIETVSLVESYVAREGLLGDLS